MIPLWSNEAASLFGWCGDGEQVVDVGVVAGHATGDVEDRAHACDLGNGGTRAMTQSGATIAFYS